MPDDFSDLKERMRGYGDVTHLFFLTMGATLYHCQAFEDRLRQYKVLVHDMRPGMSAQEIQQLLTTSRKKDTLGGLLKNLGSKVTFETKTKALLDEFLAERNGSSIISSTSMAWPSSTWRRSSPSSNGCGIYSAVRFISKSSSQN